MASLKILGWEIPAVSIVRRNPPVGERSPTLLGGLRNRKMAHRIELDITTAAMTSEDAECLLGLLSGNNHVFPFNADLWSTIGLPPVTGWTASISATQSKFGGYSASITSITWPVAFVESPGVWTVLVSRWNGSSWDDYVVRSDGAKWINGVRNDATSTTWLTFNTGAGTGAIALTGSPTYYDEVCFFPFMVSTTFATSVYAFRATTAMPTTPQGLTVESSAFTFQSLVMRCVDPPKKNAAAFRDPATGTWTNAGATITFKLVQATTGTFPVVPPDFGFRASTYPGASGAIPTGTTIPQDWGTQVWTSTSNTGGSITAGGGADNYAFTGGGTAFVNQYFEASEVFTGKTIALKLWINNVNAVETIANLAGYGLVQAYTAVPEVHNPTGVHFPQANGAWFILVFRFDPGSTYSYTAGTAYSTTGTAMPAGAQTIRVGADAGKAAPEMKLGGLYGWNNVTITDAEIQAVIAAFP